MEQTTIRGDRRRRAPFGRLRLLVPAALAAAAVVVALPGTAQPAFPGQNGEIAFSGADRSIWVMNADGSNQQKLNDFGEVPAWSPDGQKIAFQGIGEGTWQIFVMDADGSNQTRLTTNVDYDRSPAWSPDGQKIAFSREDPDSATAQIYVMNGDGSGQTPLTNDALFHEDWQPAWSPDGQKIAFWSCRADGCGGIFVMNADGSGQTRLTNLRDFAPAWSPDGQRIAFTRSMDDGAWQIFVMNTDGSGQTQLTTSATNDFKPAWSPDGQKIALSCGTEVCVMDADGSNRTQLTTAGGYTPDWQPLASQVTHTATVEQPINVDGSSVFKAGKGVLPLKFTLAVDGVTTCELPSATVALTRLSGAVSGAVNESEYALAADNGSDFRIDDCQYVYNLSLKSLSAGTYRAEIKIDGQAVGSAAFELR
jgi:dipeptidyl aminopeptidase/acylaminoacyl peptidase